MKLSFYRLLTSAVAIAIALTDTRVRAEEAPAHLPREISADEGSRGEKPYVLVVDDHQNDDAEHPYEVLMQTVPNTDLASLTTDDIVLCDATVPCDVAGKPKPRKGDRQLLVRVLDMNEPTRPSDFIERPSLCLESYERRDTLLPDAGPAALSGSRSYGTDKRLVIASRSVAPNFNILLFPHRAGDTFSITTWNKGETELTVEIAGKPDVFTIQHEQADCTIIAKKP